MHLGSGVIRVTIGTGGAGYSSAPDVSFTGGGGTGAAAVAQMAGTVVQAVVITNAGTGYTSAPAVAFSATTGSGAAGTASVLSYAGTRPLTFFKGRWNDMYGIDGHGRGFRWDGDTPQLEALGISKPLTFAAPVGSTASQKYYVTGVQVQDGGAGYANPPTVGFTGGGATTQAEGVAVVTNGRVSSVRLNARGEGYTAAPQVTFSGGQGTGAAFTCNVFGGVSGIEITSSGAGYTGAPAIAFGSTNGLTGVNVSMLVDVSSGQLVGANVLAGGTGATAAGVTASLTGGGATTQGNVKPLMEYSVQSVSVANSGSGYMTPPVITFVPAAADAFGGGAAATCAVNATGQITAVTMLAGGRYSIPPTAVIADSSAKAAATISATIKGVYKCAIRYLDDTPESAGGPIPSSISELQEVDAADGLQSITWNLNHHGMESRVHAVELWRTTADQAVVLYRVARIDKVAGVIPNTAYVDTLKDSDLLDTSRNTVSGNVTSQYGLMPIVLPSGQVNARRFEPPPTDLAVACMFQDRAWYAVDTTGAKPNSLYYSEIDEPESVPAANELVVQENVPDPDAIVALVPFGASLLVVQGRHTYKLQYVSQPIIDASITLVTYRGALNSRCWDVFAGVAFIADDYGLYAFDGNQEEQVSAAVDNYWRDGIIDLTKKKYFYLKVSAQERVVRFFYCTATDGTYPPRALCYSLATKAWWEEAYSQELPHAATSVIGPRQSVIYGGQAGGMLQLAGAVDITTAGATTPIAYELRTPPMALTDEGGSRAVGVVYSPTAETLNVSLHYNNSPSPRPNAISSTRGDGFVATAGGTAVTLDMSSARSPLGTATGYARALYSGRVDENSSGADRHVALALSGTQSVGKVQIHAASMSGVT